MGIHDCADVNSKKDKMKIPDLKKCFRVRNFFILLVELCRKYLCVIDVSVSRTLCFSYRKPMFPV